MHQTAELQNTLAGEAGGGGTEGETGCSLFKFQ